MYDFENSGDKLICIHMERGPNTSWKRVCTAQPNLLVLLYTLCIINI